MAQDLFPRTMVGGVSLSRMIIGTNWILGYSHTTPSADRAIAKRNHCPHACGDIIARFLERGVDTLMALFDGNDFLLEGVKRAEDEVGRKVIMVDTPIINVDNNPMARAEARETIRRSRERGATFCLIHHSAAEQLVCKNTHTLDRLPDYLSMIREEGMIPGLSAHMPELIVYSDEQGYDVETYIQIYNCMGFLMQVEIEYIHSVIHGAKKPVMTIKPMAAGRCSPFVGLSFSFATLRDCDMVTVGCMNPDEAVEDVEYGLAALERRKPDLEGRNSPNKTAIMK